MAHFVKTTLVGVGATFAIDCWTTVLKLFGIRTQGVTLVGRWLAYLPDGKFFHNTILQTPPIASEQLFGGIVHYCIGVAFAFLLVYAYGKNWLVHPRLLPAIYIAFATLILPIFFFQPAVGFGIGFFHTPRPSVLLLNIFLIHMVYGIGLYLSAKLIHILKKMYRPLASNN